MLKRGKNSVRCQVQEITSALKWDHWQREPEMEEIERMQWSTGRDRENKFRIKADESQRETQEEKNFSTETQLERAGERTSGLEMNLRK